MPSITAPVPSPVSPAVCNWREAGFAVYVHWPFCQAKCPYCDFNSHVAASVDQASWREAFAAELARAAEMTEGRTVGSVFFGGGTPSLMEPQTVGAILDAISAHWTVDRNAEVTLEANPTSVEADRFRGYRAAGVNRLSLGVQALDDGDLRRLGRLHSAAEARAALRIATDVFPRVSADLIYARQDQASDAWSRELREVLQLGLGHLSLYQLTVEDGTVFGERHRRGLLRGLPDEDAAADLLALTQELCEDSGVPAYEVSNHARAAEQSQHNLTYWRAGDWIGVGPGAVGRVSYEGARWASASPVLPASWLEAARAVGGAVTWTGGEDHGQEYLMMGLRLAEGVSLRRLQQLGGALDEGAVATLIGDGLLRRDAERLRATRDGRPLLNAILRALL